MLAPTEDLPIQGSPEFKRACDRVHRELAAKFAWTAQHDGMIYRQEPASLKPMNDKTFNRISRAAHSFRYRTDKGHTRLYFVEMDEIIAVLDDPSLDIGVAVTERVEFMPGQSARMTLAGPC
ncbi:hypothetical protein V1277_003679 [Bradyrhizobium sp. AZCC 1588]|uniref:hypothetical protein n=1 Tax=unclassified Bradyrhizobium TaxID=2631580 RepID=UPI002FF1F540